KLRHHGTMLGRIVYEGLPEPALKDPNLENLVKSASIAEPVLYAKGGKKVVLVDCGVKNNIIRAFLKRDITVLRVPWDYDFSKEKADGYIISNGPGDPKQCAATIAHTRKALALNTPILGICLGSQILGLAAGANTYKLKFGHRGQNQPCVESGTRRCYITSQNHGYAIETNSLPEDWREWFYNANDQTNEGIKHIAKPYFGTQFHPEASPGPDDTEFLFDMFLRAVGS
ncbi:MAG: carbamoyl phosphate synthase small subunit, partial [Desulfobacteraceae bacterium]